MSAKDIAIQTSQLCVGAVALSLGDPSGGTALALPAAALAAIGFTLKSGCARKGCDKAEKAILTAAAASAGSASSAQVYAGDHGWTVPDSPAYNEAAAEQAWADLLEMYRVL